MSRSFASAPTQPVPPPPTTTMRAIVRCERHGRSGCTVVEELGWSYELYRNSRNHVGIPRWYFADPEEYDRAKAEERERFDRLHNAQLPDGWIIVRERHVKGGDVIREYCSRRCAALALRALDREGTF